MLRWWLDGLVELSGGWVCDAGDVVSSRDDVRVGCHVGWLMCCRADVQVSCCGGRVDELC